MFHHADAFRLSRLQTVSTAQPVQWPRAWAAWPGTPSWAITTTRPAAVAASASSTPCVRVRLGKNFDNKNKDKQRMGMFSTKDVDGKQSPSVMGSVKDAVRGAWARPEMKDVADMIETPMKDAKGNIMMGADGKPVMKQTPQYNEDGSMKTRKEATGKLSGIAGRVTNVVRDMSQTYKEASHQKK